MRSSQPLQFGAHPATPTFVLTPVACLGTGSPTPGLASLLVALSALERIYRTSSQAPRRAQSLVGISFVFLSSWPLSGSLGLIQRPLPVQEDSGEGLRVCAVHSTTSLDWGCREPASSPRAALCATQSFRRANPPARRLQLPCGPGGRLLLTPPIVGPTQSPPAFQVRVGGVGGARGVHSRVWSRAPLNAARWRQKAARMRTSSPRTARRERTRQRDGGGPATTAETNGAPGERDRQEILLNQDTVPKRYCCYYY